MNSSPATSTNDAARIAAAGDASGNRVLFARLLLAPLHFLRGNLFGIGIAGVLYAGWIHRSENYLSAETGTGYVLGIAGCSLMLGLLLYPLSKRMKLLTRWIPLRYWFRIHMLCGIVGPVMILFHSNFQLGSTNSSIALISMLLVAASGLIGRYIYTNIHHGLYGSRITLNELRDRIESEHRKLTGMYAHDQDLSSSLKRMEATTLQAGTGLIRSILHVTSLAVRARQMKNAIRDMLENSRCAGSDGAAFPETDAVVHAVHRYTRALRRTAALKVYERLFSLWHILHLPLFVMMIITAVIHIFAVHMY